MSNKRICRECHKPHGDPLAVCVECNHRLGHYAAEKSRQNELWKIRWGFTPPAAVTAARRAKQRRQMRYAQGGGREP